MPDITVSDPQRLLDYQLLPIGKPFTKPYTIYHTLNGKIISPFHDIPLNAKGSESIFNMVVEIPKWTNAKFEINLGKPFNPIIQDTKKGKLRFIKNCFPIHGYYWNYGSICQTWENSTKPDPRTGFPGDNDPLDVCEIGTNVGVTGQVKQVKILGCTGLLDSNETDWKIIAIDVTDPLASQLNDIADVDRLMPNFLNVFRSWLKIYKLPEDKPVNKLAYDGEFKGRDFALEIIADTHNSWRDLMERRTICKNISLHNSQLNNSFTIIDPHIPNEASEIESDVDWNEVNKWYYLDEFKL